MIDLVIAAKGGLIALGSIPPLLAIGYWISRIRKGRQKGDL